MTVRYRPVTPEGLVEEVLSRIGPPERGRLRVGVDGAPTAAPGPLAERLLEPLRVTGRYPLHVPASRFLRAASLRLERGRTNPDAFYEDWLDLSALTREVLDPAAPDGTGLVLPSLRDPTTDRATRAGYVRLPPGAVVIVSGALLLGAGLDFDLTVHLAQSPAALVRRTDPACRWTLPAFARYAEEVMPELLADVVARVDDPRHPALLVSG